MYICRPVWYVGGNDKSSFLRNAYSKVQGKTNVEKNVAAWGSPQIYSVYLKNETSPINPYSKSELY